MAGHLAAVLAGAAMLLWPAALNHYPIVFSDLGGLLSMGHEPEIGWDKPWVYGPFLRAADGGVTLWLPMLAQGLILSHTLWLVQRAVAGGGAGRHLAVCAVLAGGSAAPWFAALLMPDIFAPVCVLSLFLLGLAPPGALSRREQAWLVALAAFAIAAHLAHLIVACACLAVVLLLRWRRLAVAGEPLVLALAWLVAANLVGNGVAGVSPYGAIFALARLQADGPAARYLQDVCPAAGYRLCAWASELPEDSDSFLWHPDGPVWGHDYGPTLMVGEAQQVVAASLRAYPWMAARAAAANTLAQAGLAAVGDTLGPDYLDVTVLPRLERFFPAAEAARFEAGLQDRGLLAAAASPFLWPQRALLIAGLLGTLAAILLAWRGWPVLAGLALMVLAALAANAFATGALSHPHDRYGARIAWLVLLPPLLALIRPRNRGAATNIRAMQRNTLIGGLLAAIVAGMTGLSFAAVPLYRAFCAATGYGGTPQIGPGAAPGGSTGKITVAFNADVNPNLPWRFTPEARQVTLELGDQQLAFFDAKNLGAAPITGVALYNVTPETVGRYFHKTQCFCFDSQTLQPGEAMQFPVTFWVDPAIARDPETRDVHTITLSYTFFRSLDDAARNGALAKAGPHSANPAQGRVLSGG